MRPRPLLVAAAGTAVLLATLLVSLLWSFGPSGALAWKAPSGTPPPTPVPPFGSLSPFPTVLHTPEPSLEPPALSAPTAILEDLDTGQVLFSKHPAERRPIASITKIMTALLVLESTKLSDTATVSESAAGQPGSVLELDAGERIPVRDLLWGLLVQSANDAAVVLAEHVAGSADAFVQRMNDRAASMGLRDTTFFSPNGLDDRGFSTVGDIALLTRTAMRRPLFARIVRTKVRDIPAPSGESRRVQNRNVLLWLYRGAVGVKTGYTPGSGYALVAAAEREGRRLLAVVLGDPLEPFDDSAALLNYGFAAFRQVDLVREGDLVGQVRIEGQTVTVVAGRTVSWLVRADLVDTVERTLAPAGDASLPIRQGQWVGTVTLEVAGRRVGSVGALAAISVSRGPEAVLPRSGAAALLRSTLRIVTVVMEAVFEPFL